MTAARDHRTHPATWLVGAVLIGWIVIYNLLRIAGRSPDQAAWLSLAIGGGLGAALYLGGVWGLRRLAASGRVVRQTPREITADLALDATERAGARVVAGALAAVAAVALLTGVALGTQWLTATADQRAVTLLVLTGWNLLAAYWFADEAVRVAREQLEGVESLALGAALTAVLAAVAIGRDYFPALQVLLIVLAGIAGAAVGLLTWRLHAVRTPPIAGPLVVVVAVLALVLPHTG
ncbi:MAG TPA: hypothetical protein PKE32_10135 [Miltoncostaeaceae bacterium]|nr:hypothetical protein [Miltoncostaeaceae bacterium]